MASYLDNAEGILTLNGVAVPLNQAGALIAGPGGRAVLQGSADIVPLQAVFVARRGRFELDASGIRGEWGTAGLVTRRQGSFGIVQSVRRQAGVSRSDKRDSLGMPYETVCYQTPKELGIRCVLLGREEPEIGDEVMFSKGGSYQVGGIGDSWEEGEFRVVDLTLWGGLGWQYSQPATGIAQLG